MGGPLGGGGFGMPDFKTLTQPRVHFSSVGSNFGSTFTIGTQGRKVAVYTTFIVFVFEIPTLSVDAICKR